MKILKFLAWEEGGLIWENSNYATTFLIPKVQKGTQKISWKIVKYLSSWPGKKVDSSGKIPTMPPHSSYLKSRREPKKSRGSSENTSSWPGKKVDSSGKIPTMPPHSSY